MEDHLEVLLELCFFTKPLKFGVEAHMEAPTGLALSALMYSKDSVVLQFGDLLRCTDDPSDGSSWPPRQLGADGKFCNHI
jgi:hypothetical protein